MGQNAKDKGKITNSYYQTLNDVSKATATRELTELVEKFNILKRTGDIGAGTSYTLIGSFGSNDEKPSGQKRCRSILYIEMSYTSDINQ
ncbi:MAG: hypothetical protein U1C46_11440 [Bacteroidales bacterium]|nr:hypothetical protein [Bacteroidales bacterium]MDZ4205414.1 hypothetical protein [Bacteroidales bacterium]